jgi:hypothetical protein
MVILIEWLTKVRALPAVPAKLLEITVSCGGRTMVQNFIEVNSVVFVSLMTLRDRLTSISIGLYRYLWFRKIRCLLLCRYYIQ